MGHCPYSDDELQQWDSVANPMGDACDDCDDYDCEHNLNPDPSEPCFNEDAMDRAMAAREVGEEYINDDSDYDDIEQEDEGDGNTTEKGNNRSE